MGYPALSLSLSRSLSFSEKNDFRGSTGSWDRESWERLFIAPHFKLTV